MLALPRTSTSLDSDAVPRRWRRVTRAAAALVAVAATLAACGDDDDDDGAAPPGTRVRLSLDHLLAPGEEAFLCRYVALPAGGIDVGRFEHDYTPGTHHVLVYPTSLRPDDVPAETFDCRDLGAGGQTGVAYGTDDNLTGGWSYPDGVAMRFGAGAVALLEAHYLNGTDQPLPARVAVDLIAADRAPTTLAGTLFFYDWSILVPPRPATTRSQMSCVIPGDVQLRFATSHMHRRGTAFESHLISAGAAPRLLHRTDSWEAPESADFDPPLAVRAGDRIDFACDFVNDLDRPVVEGESAATDEMCMFIASYWPRLDEDVESCQAPGSGPALRGTQACAAALSCLEEAGDRVTEQTCAAATCAASAPALHAFLGCAERHACTTESCLAEHCAEPYEVCAAAGC
jgi:hypothetical protein